MALLAALEISLRLGSYGYNPHFFKRIKIGNEDYFVQNDEFSYRFFPAETARSPGVIRMPVHKAPGTYRIFVFGESAAMGDPEPAFGAYRYLEMLLREKYPDKKFEIINVAFTAINSHVIVPIARECAEHEGDLWIIYMGNNEMVGPFGAATVFGRQAPPWPYVRLVTALQRTRTAQLLTAWSRKLFQRHSSNGTAWGGMEMFLNNQIAPGNPLKEIVYRNFKKNLDDIARAGMGSGAKILLNTVAVNLKDCPPFASLNSLQVSEPNRTEFTNLFANGCNLENESNFTKAASEFEQASKLDPQFADLQFHWGQCLLARPSLADAREHLQLACDDDALSFRADARINGIIRTTGGKFAGEGLTLFDAANALATNDPSGVCGQETFYEHVHFNFDGSYRLGVAWAQQIEKMLGASVTSSNRPWASQETCEQLLGLSDWNRVLIYQHMLGRMKLPPLSSQPNNAQRATGLESRVQQWKAQMNQNDAEAAKANFEKQIAASPDDFLLRENYALFLQSNGELPQCIEQWRRVHDLVPQDYLPYFQIGHVLGEEGQLGEREADLRAAVQIRPSLTEGWIELGNAQAEEKKFPEALASYAVALQQRPGDPEAISHIGKVYGVMGRHEEAVQYYRDAIKFDPNAWQPHYELGGEMDVAGRLDDALQEFAAAAHLNPGYSRAHFNYGILLAKHSRFDEAQHEFEETLRLEPDYKNAQESLAKVRQVLQHSAKN